MPTYDMKNVETGEVKEMILKIADKEAMVESGEWVQIHLGAMTTVTHVGGPLSKTSTDWRNLLGRIKSNSGRVNSIKTY